MRNTIGYHAYSMAHGLIIIIKIFVSIGEREKKMPENALDSKNSI